jgi:hypothetical protein
MTRFLQTPVAHSRQGQQELRKNLRACLLCAGHAGSTAAAQQVSIRSRAASTTACYGRRAGHSDGAAPFASMLEEIHGNESLEA